MVLLDVTPRCGRGPAPRPEARGRTSGYPHPGCRVPAVVVVSLPITHVTAMTRDTPAQQGEERDAPGGVHSWFSSPPCEVRSSRCGSAGAGTAVRYRLFLVGVGAAVVGCIAVRVRNGVRPRGPGGGAEITGVVAVSVVSMLGAMGCLVRWGERRGGHRNGTWSFRVLRGLLAVRRRGRRRAWLRTASQERELGGSPRWCGRAGRRSMQGLGRACCLPWYTWAALTRAVTVTGTTGRSVP
jgi:hypothetical protein